MGAVTSVPPVRPRLPLFLLLPAVALGLLVWSGTAASADCQGPTLQFEPAAAPRGGEITVAGTGFGDNCYDTEPPPDGEGVLGRPQRDLQVLLVQGGEELVVAKGDAGADYAFEVTVVVPAALEPGPARFVARLADGGEAFVPQADGLVITDAAPIEGADEAVVTFGDDDEEAAGEAPGPAGESGGQDDGPPWVVIGSVLLFVSVAAAGLYPMRRMRRGA